METKIGYEGSDKLVDPPITLSGRPLAEALPDIGKDELWALRRACKTVEQEANKEREKEYHKKARERAAADLETYYKPEVAKYRKQFRAMGSEARAAFLAGLRFAGALAMETNYIRRARGWFHIPSIETHDINSNHSSLSYVHKKLEEQGK